MPRSQDPNKPLNAKQQSVVDAYLTPGTSAYMNQTEAYRQAGYWVGKSQRTATNQASLFFGLPKVEAYIERVRREATERTVRGAQHVLEELWHDADALKPLVLVGDGRPAAANARKGILELLGRHYRNWSPDDAADATADHIPLAERLKHYQREQAIDEAPNVERLHGTKA